MLLISKHSAIKNQKNKDKQLDAIYQYDLLSRFYFLYSNLKIEEKKKISFLGFNTIKAFSKTGCCNYLNDYIERIERHKKTINGTELSLSEKHNALIHPLLVGMKRIKLINVIDKEININNVDYLIHETLKEGKKNWQVILGDVYLFFKNGIYSIKSGLFVILKSDEIVLKIQQKDCNEYTYQARRVCLEQNISKKHLSNVYKPEYPSIITQLAILPLEDLVSLPKENYERTLKEIESKKIS